MPQEFIVLVGAIPIRDGKVLVLQRSERETFMPGAWGLPCGKLEFGEDLAAGVLRELHEETGLAGTVRSLCGCSTFMSEMNGVSLHNVQVNYVIDAPAGAVRLDPANQAFRWISLSTYRDSDLDAFTKQAIDQCVTTAQTSS